MSANDDLLDAAIRRQIEILRAANGLAADQARLLAEKLYEPLEELFTVRMRHVSRQSMIEASERTSKRLAAIFEKVDEVSGEAFREARKALESDLVELAARQATWAATSIEAAVPIQLSVTAPARNYLRSIVVSRPFQGRFLREAYSDLDSNVRRAVRAQIRQGLQAGESVPQMVRRIRGTRAAGYKDGLVAQSRRQVEAVVRTAANHVSNHAREATYAENPELIKGVLWVSTLDSRTTLTCAALDGKTFEPNEGPRPPAHWNCRSTTTPVLRSWKELGIDLDEAPPSTRASLDGQVPEDLTFDAWFKKQGAGFQLDYLGPSRFAKYRETGSIGALVTQSYKPIPVSAL